MPRLSVSQMKPLTYLLTYSIVQSPFWEANWFAASQEIPRISRNPKVHYRTLKRPPPVPILGQSNPIHIPTPHLLEIHPNIIHPSTPRSPQWSPSLRFPQQGPIHPPLLTHTRHMPSPSHSSRFYHTHNIWWGVQIILPVMLQNKIIFLLHFSLLIFFTKHFTFQIMASRYLTSSSEFASNTKFIISQWIDKNVERGTEHHLKGHKSTRAVRMVPLGSPSRDSDVRMDNVHRT